MHVKKWPNFVYTRTVTIFAIRARNSGPGHALLYLPPLVVHVLKLEGGAHEICC